MEARSVLREPTTISLRLARLKATLRRRQSESSAPMLPSPLLRTRLSTTHA